VVTGRGERGAAHRRAPRQGRPSPSGSGRRCAPRSSIDNEISGDFSVVDVYTQDRLGVLYTITRTLASLQLDIQLSKVATEADRVADVFYVREQGGGKALRPPRRRAEAGSSARPWAPCCVSCSLRKLQLTEIFSRRRRWLRRSG